MSTQKNRNESENPRGASSLSVEEQGVRVNGYKQVLEMLRFADPAFRESLLRRLASERPELAKALKREL
jgi:hypothetical protein